MKFSNYSQSTEQDFILTFFKGKNDGTFLDIGFNDGITVSNTYALALLGWSGTGIEASEIAFKKAVETHKGNKKIDILNYALYNKNGKVPFFESGNHFTKDDWSLLGTLKEEEIQRWNGSNNQFTEKYVDAIDFKTMLSLTKFSKFDFVSIDIEGAEMLVLPQIDFDKLGTKLVCIEWNSNIDNLNDYNNFFTPKGFKIVHNNTENLFYAKQ